MTSLLLPAAIGARERARSISCSNNLRQIGLAVHSYADGHGTLPSTTGFFTWDHLWPPRFHYPKHFSVHTRILPYLENQQLFNQINFNVEINDFFMFSNTERLPGFASNLAAMSTAVGGFLCSADGAPFGARTGANNYRANDGSDRWSLSTDGPFLNKFTQLTWAATTDGLANTALFSEKLRGRAESLVPDPFTDMYDGGRGIPYTVDESRSNCPDRRRPLRSRSEAGLSWFIGTLTHTTYNHSLAPNDRIPDCLMGWFDAPAGHFAARSRHPGGVNVGMADGSVRFVRDGVSRPVWAAVGTRAGGELVRFD